MFCTKCGKPIADNAFFCKYCGNNLSSVKVVKTPQVNASGNAIYAGQNNSYSQSFYNQSNSHMLTQRSLQARICPGCGAPMRQGVYECEYCGIAIEKNEPVVQQVIRPQPIQQQPVQVTQIIQQGNQGLSWGDAAKIAVTNNAVKAGTQIATEVTKGIIRSFLPW